MSRSETGPSGGFRQCGATWDTRDTVVSRDRAARDDDHTRGVIDALEHVEPVEVRETQIEQEQDGAARGDVPCERLARGDAVGYVLDARAIDAELSERAKCLLGMHGVVLGEHDREGLAPVSECPSHDRRIG